MKTIVEYTPKGSFLATLGEAEYMVVHAFVARGCKLLPALNKARAYAEAIGLKFEDVTIETLGPPLPVAGYSSKVIVDEFPLHLQSTRPSHDPTSLPQ